MGDLKALADRFQHPADRDIALDVAAERGVDADALHWHISRFVLRRHDVLHPEKLVVVCILIADRERLRRADVDLTVQGVLVAVAPRALGTLGVQPQRC